MPVILILLFLTLAAGASPSSFHEVFPGVSVLTTFAHDHGDMLDSIAYQGTRFDSVSEATASILPRFGWDKPENRIRLGTVWADEVVLFGSDVVESGMERRVELLPDGTFHYTTWAVSMRGRSPGSRSDRWQIAITPQAELRVTRLESSGDGPGAR
jgi:hypothetical protein